jgi:DNA-binding NarL/FixJ family response regulator
MVRVVFAEDQSMTRAAYRLLLLDLGVDVLGLAEDGNQAVSEIEKKKPDVAVLDVQMPRATGIDAVRTLRARKNPTPVILLTTFDDAKLYADALRAGMDGWILKGEDPDDLKDAIAMVADGKTRLVPPSDDDEVMTLPPLAEDLTPRETDVIRLAARGMSNKSIGDALGTTEGTVRNQMSSIIQKLHATSRWDAVRIAALRRIL